MATHFVAGCAVALAVLFAVKGCNDTVEEVMDNAKKGDRSDITEMQQPPRKNSRPDPCKNPPNITGRTPRLDEMCLEPTPETPSR